VQPWRVRIVDPSRADLFIERARTLPDEDVTGSFIILSMGIFVEALSLAAAHYGLQVEAKITASLDSFTAPALREREERVVRFAELTLRADTRVVPEVPLQRLHDRRTSRLHYGPDPVPATDAARLAELATKHGHRYAQVTNPTLIEKILALNVEAVFCDLGQAPYRNELRQWLRYSERESRRRGDGLEAKCMNVAPAELWAAFHLPAILHLPGLRSWLRRRYRAQIGPVATMGFLCGGFWDPVEAYGAGRLLLRFWLEVTGLGYYIHPYGNLVTNRAIAERVRAETGLADVWLAFKIGRSVPPPASRRRTVEAVLLD
jgi:hypothetical protein